MFGSVFVLNLQWVFSIIRRVITMNTFNESAIASYVKTRAEENCKLLQENMEELERGKILGRMEAYNEFLERFGFDKVECK
ncbi:hypothetical protein AZ46_0209890 [Metabacillus indicus LMG 22858]|uniref:Uncharacterized protein n=2 Tax=Bacillaceae TaxID=186817 RepID=A0A084GW98_METID|nr:hypothetical protein AZ46_0209890 [Metabacillus indicus LMG 22858]KEZ51610.1 hypothetical protein GS18_0210790 [Metabacillus indicus]